MSEPIVVKEYSEKRLDNCDLIKLQKYLECKNLGSAITVTPTGIKTKSWVGVIKYKNAHLEILPKLICDNEDDKECIIRNLIYMLSYTKDLDIKINDNAKLSTEKNPFIEVLIGEYAKSLFDCLKRTTPKKYVREDDNLRYLKGKIKFAENIRYNCTNNSRFYCEYDEFSENNNLNQLFLFVSSCLYSISNNSKNKKILKFIINYYSDINLVRFDKFKVQKIRLNRNQELFKRPFKLAKMFIEQTSVDLSRNKFENITLVWDMNYLFEKFIFEIMKKHEAEFGCKFDKQRNKLLLAENNRRTTKVDIMVEKDDEQIIIDTKYKKFENEDSFSNYDVYQVSTYCLLHKANHAILLYPQWGKERLEIPKNHLNTGDNNYQIDFKTINLKYGNLRNNIKNIKDEIKTILGVS